MKNSYCLHLFFIAFFFNLSAKKSRPKVQVKFVKGIKSAHQRKLQELEKYEKIQKKELLKLEQQNNPTSLRDQLKKIRPSAEKLIYIIITGKNHSDWYKKNLDSVMTQKYSNFHVMYLLDTTSSDVPDYIQAYIQEKKWGDKITLIHTQEQNNLENIYHAISLCPDNAIVTICNSNDWYENRDVLTLFNKIYEDKNVWLTYGSCTNSIRKPGLSAPCKKIPKAIALKRSFRTYRWVTGQPQTFYAWLFKRIKKEDLMINGEFFKIPDAQERAIMYPLLEMAGHRFKFIPDTIYVHNSEVCTISLTRTMPDEFEKYYVNILQERKKYDFLKSSGIAHDL